MDHHLIELAGWVPAIIFPSATSLQLAKIVSKQTAEGVSIASWLFFGLANIGLYLYAEKYTSLQSVVALLLTAVLDFMIVGVALAYGSRTNTGGEGA